MKSMSKGRQFITFTAVLISGFLLFGGIAVATLMYWPVLDDYIGTRAPVVYQPDLPLAEDIEDEYLDIEEAENQAIIPYPALAEVHDVSDTGDWIYIPSIDVRVPLVMSPTMKDDDVLKTLDVGAALYPNGVEPGRLGNTFVSAHSTGEPWKGKYRFAFLRIDELTNNNSIHLDYQGTRYTYRIAKKEIVTPTPDFLVVSGRPVPTVTLMACWPLWTTDKRMLITAELTNVTKLTPTPA